LSKRQIGKYHRGPGPFHHRRLPAPLELARPARVRGNIKEFPSSSGRDAQATCYDPAKFSFQRFGHDQIIVWMGSLQNTDLERAIVIKEQFQQVMSGERISVHQAGSV